jgi:hypothetical protein
VDVELDDTLDCLICREPLATTARALATLSLHFPDIDNSSLPRIAASQSTDIAVNISVNNNTVETQQAFSHEDDEPIPEPTVRTRHCTYTYGSSCLSTCFATKKSNRCPKCNQLLFPERGLHLILDHPTRKIVENVLEDVDTANLIRSQLMSEWTRTRMRELAVEIHRSRGYESFTWEYRNGAASQEREDESSDD